jgi:hypothetical protein
MLPRVRARPVPFLMGEFPRKFKGFLRVPAWRPLSKTTGSGEGALRTRADAGLLFGLASRRPILPHAEPDRFSLRRGPPAYRTGSRGRWNPRLLSDRLGAVCRPQRTAQEPWLEARRFLSGAPPGSLTAGSELRECRIDRRNLGLKLVQAYLRSKACEFTKLIGRSRHALSFAR